MRKIIHYFIAPVLILAVVVGVVFNFNNGSAGVVYAYTLDDRGQLPGEYRGVSTTFDIKRSNYQDVSVIFDTETEAHIESITGMVGMRISPGTEDLGITVSNLKPGTTYYKYVDHLDNKEEITTDETGSVTFQNNSSEESYIMIFEHPSTYFLEDNATGGDCASFANWDNVNKICRLGGNITQSIEIKDSGITLDGDLHTVQGPDSNIGVYVNGGVLFDITDVTVKNITIKGFSKGLHLNNANNINLTNVTVEDNSDGVEFFRANESSITGSTITNNTGKGLIVGTSSDINDISGNTITSNGVGIDLGLNTESSITRNDIKLNGNGVAVSAIGGSDTFLWQNNIDNTNQISILFDGDTAFYKAIPDRGNFWADHSCTPDATDANICTNRYTIPVILLPDKHDEFPWACEDAWLPGADCSPPPPAGGGGDWAEIDSTTGTTKLYQAADESSTELKILPNDWAVEVLDDSGATFWQVEDVTDNTVGYIKASELDDDSARQGEMESRALVNKTTTELRKDVIVEAVDRYYNNTATSHSIYSSDDRTNNISKLKTVGFNMEILLAIFSGESGGINFDNNWVSYDFGHGITQVTTESLVGLASNISIPSCELPNNRRDCYGAEYWSVGHRKRDYRLYEYYDNSLQSIFANVKDSMRTVRSKYDLVNNAQATSTITLTEMKNISATYRYNQGSPFKSQMVYEIWDGKTNTEIRNGPLGVKLFIVGSTETNQNTWINNVRDVCTAVTFKRCLEVASNKNNRYVISPLYLSSIGNSLKNSSFGPSYDNVDLGNKMILANESSIILQLGSPAVLRAIDPSGNVTDLSGENIPNSIFSEEDEIITIFFPDNSNQYEVIGTGSGQYSLSVIFIEGDNAIRFIAHNIETNLDESHTYSFDWESVRQGENGVSIEADTDGDGSSDVEFTSDDELTREEFLDAMDLPPEGGGKQKVTVCHIPPGKPAKAREISIGEPALSAHLRHGDLVGSCE